MNRDLFGDKPVSGRQFPLDLAHRPALGREDFWVTGANSRAVAMVDRWPDWRSHAVLVIGARGAGKTHLAEVWRAMSGARRTAAADLSAQDVPQLLENGALVVEDAPGEGLDESALFHLLNFAHERGAHVLVTSRLRPTAWDVALPDLISRLNALEMAELSEPDDALLRQVLAKLFADRQVSVDDSVLDYLVVRMERELGAAQDMVEMLDARALAEQTSITRPFAAKVLKNQRS